MRDMIAPVLPRPTMPAPSASPPPSPSSGRRPRARWEGAVERGLVPDAVLRAAIRARTAARVRAARSGTPDERSERFRTLLADLGRGPVTVHTDDANAQHYEVPTEFFELVLGPRLKYSGCYWPEGTRTLGQAEEAMLALTAERAGLADGQRVLDLGCGWGSLSLWLAERHPGSEIVAASNSRTQREHIERRAAERGLGNVSVVTADVATFTPPGRFDRVVSVEMLEHVRDHETVLGRMRASLEPDGRCFVHVFTHRDCAWLYDHTDASDWIGRHFFSGGLMPSDDLLLHVTGGMRVADHWRVSGEHYARTGEAWLANLDAHHDAALDVLARAHGERAAVADLARWRLFMLVVAEVWGWRGGDEFAVSHYLFAP
jgi:cyclopropane-fatty-acyl-phospholipid synthase